MDAKARQALVDTLAIATNFEASFNQDNRSWFVSKLISVYEGRGDNDAAIKSKATLAVSNGTRTVTKHRDFKLALKLGQPKEAATERGQRTRRVEILYSLIAHDPELADAGNEAQLLFAARRRCRVISRFQFFVNPNGRGYFRYPEACPGNKEWRVGAAASAHWARTTANYTPVEIVKPPNPPDFLAALDKLYVRTDDPCTGNLFDCEVTLSIQYMDSLREAKTPAKLFQDLYASQGSRYLCIARATAAPIFSADTSPQSLFSVTNRPQTDLCVGDHVYIFNHGLYKILLPGGSWRGEHAIVTDCGDRSVANDTGFKFMGHGLPHGGGTAAIPRFYGNLLNELNTHLYRAFRTGGIFLFYMKSGGTAFPGKVSKETHNVTDQLGASRAVDFYFFNIDFSYPNFEKRVGRQKTPGKKSEQGFVVWHIAALNQFGIHGKKTIAAAAAKGISRDENRAHFRRSGVPANAAELYEPYEWAIPFPESAGGEGTHKVFQLLGSALQMRMLEMKDLYSHPFFRTNANPKDLWMTRTKVDTGSTYSSFLTSHGAI